MRTVARRRGPSAAFSAWIVTVSPATGYLRARRKAAAKECAQAPTDATITSSGDGPASAPPGGDRLVEGQGVGVDVGLAGHAAGALDGEGR